MGDVNQNAFSATTFNIFLQWIQIIYTIALQLGPLNFHHLVFVTSNIQIIMRTITRKNQERLLFSGYAFTVIEKQNKKRKNHNFSLCILLKKNEQIFVRCFMVFILYIRVSQEYFGLLPNYLIFLSYTPDNLYP